MKDFNTIKANPKIQVTHMAEDGGACQIWTIAESRPMTVVFSNGGGWDHVSVSYPNRDPKWEEMCYIKDLFFQDEECVIQYHPPVSQYKNFHKHCLHLWRQQDTEQAMPPLRYV